MEQSVHQQPPSRQFEPENLSIEYYRYLDALVGDMIATNGGHGMLEIEITPAALREHKAEHTWVKTGHKAGYQY
jgi:hypothetical protein